MVFDFCYVYSTKKFEIKLQMSFFAYNLQKSLKLNIEIKMNPINSKALPKTIKKGYELIFAQQDLTAREANLFGLMIAHMSPDDWLSNSPVYTFTSEQLVNWVGLNPLSVSSQLKVVCDRLSSRKISAFYIDEEGNGEFDFIPLLKHAKYKKGTLTLIPNDVLKRQYIEYKKGFALIHTSTYLALKREYTKKLYEILSQFKDQCRTKLHPQSIEDLKAYMGLLDEKKKLKKGKQSFDCNYLFVKRCIKESIEELIEHPIAGKELLFKESDDGNLGYRLIKNGKNIIAVEFIYHWIDRKDPVQALLFEEAKGNITRLETKRLTSNDPLSNEELELLMYSYRSIGKDNFASEIESALTERAKVEKDPAPEDDLSFLDKITELKKINGDKKY